jgi:hypothetical protein
LIAVVQLPQSGKPTSEMTDSELDSYVRSLLDGGVFDNVPGPLSDRSSQP